MMPTQTACMPDDNAAAPWVRWAGTAAPRSAWMLALALCMAQAAKAQQLPEPATPASKDEVLDSARRSVRSTAEWLARGVDSWFGDKPFEEGGGVTNGRLSLSLLTRQREKPQLDLRFTARFRLPNIDQGAYLFLGRDDPRDVLIDKPGAISRPQRLLRGPSADPLFFAGFGARFLESFDARLGFRGGLKPYAQARYGLSRELGDAGFIDFRETLFWSVDERWGSTTAATYEHAFSPTLTGRWLSTATITTRSKKLEWSSSAGAFKAFGGQKLLSIEALFSGVKGAAVPVADYGLQLKWEQPIHEDWLIAEVLVGQFWPRADVLSPRSRARAVGGSLLLRF